MLPHRDGVDKADEAAKTEATSESPLPVLSDPDLAIHGASRVVHKTDAAEADKLKGFGIDLEKSSGRTHNSFAIPALFLIDRAGVVRWAHAGPDYEIRSEDPPDPRRERRSGALQIARGSGPGRALGPEPRPEARYSAASTSRSTAGSSIDGPREP